MAKHRCENPRCQFCFDREGKPINPGHTAGEWYTKPENAYVAAQVWCEGMLLADVYGESRAARKANAEVMAAASDLLAQLEALIVQLDNVGLIVPPMARAAVDKARGRA
jgi:hypothetical protein